MTSAMTAAMTAVARIQPAAVCASASDRAAPVEAQALRNLNAPTGTSRSRV